MRTRNFSCALLIALSVLKSVGLQTTAQLSECLASKAWSEKAEFGEHSPYQRQGTWYEFILKQFNPDNVDYSKWVEQRRIEFFNLRLKNPYFLYSFWTTIALLLATAGCVKQRIDLRRRMWITAEMMADLYNQDAYTRQVAQEAIERYNKHIERCNRAAEVSENHSGAAATGSEIEQLRTDLMRVAEERDAAIRDRDIARQDLRRKSGILADMSVRLEAATTKSTSQGSAKGAADVRNADARLVGHINNLQEQLYAERTNNRKLKGG